MLLNNIHRLVYVLKHNVSETGLCLRPQVKPTLLGPIGRTSPYLRALDIVQKHNECTNVPSSQTFRFYVLLD
jgi:hypothetical protein